MVKNVPWALYLAQMLAEMGLQVGEAHLAHDLIMVMNGHDCQGWGPTPFASQASSPQACQSMPSPNSVR
jgi:hypothetical protein